ATIGQAYPDADTVPAIEAPTETWVPDSVVIAEARAPRRPAGGGYLGAYDEREWMGVPGYLEAIAPLIFGEYTTDLLATQRLAAASTAGGTGALLTFALTTRATHLGSNGIPPTVMSRPGYSNHEQIWNGMGIGGDDRIIKFDQVDQTTGQYNFAGHMAAIKSAPSQAIALLQTADNPTGMNPSAEQWEAMAKTMARKNMFALFDIPYPGFTPKGFAADTDPIRIFMKHGVRLAVAVSFSKIMSQYFGRAGAIFMPMASKLDALDYTRTFSGAARITYSTPPAQSQLVVRELLQDDALTEQWLLRDLPGYAEVLANRRLTLAKNLSGKVPDQIINVIAAGEGMYFVLPITPAGVQYLRDVHGVFVIGNGRCNLGSVNTSLIPRVAEGIADVFQNHPEFVMLPARRD
ncbi:MAG: aminotransferase class I/II-fold pyridoxal phosphate-dependent enzyme, partial [Candidatus Levyibacteriota bacterium]